MFFNLNIRNDSNEFCILESFNTNISHQISDYTITFLTSKVESKIYFVILESKINRKSRVFFISFNELGLTTYLALNLENNC